MKKITSCVFLLLSTITLPVLANETPLTKLLIEDSAKKTEPLPTIAPVTSDILSPEAKNILKQNDDFLAKIPPKVKEELLKYKEERQKLYDNLSSEAKDILTQRNQMVKNIPPAIKDELKKNKENELLN
jgi:hypothetical protein